MWPKAFNGLRLAWPAGATPAGGRRTDGVGPVNMAQGGLDHRQPVAGGARSHSRYGFSARGRATGGRACFTVRTPSRKPARPARRTAPNRLEKLSRLWRWRGRCGFGFGRPRWGPWSRRRLFRPEAVLTRAGRRNRNRRNRNGKLGIRRYFCPLQQPPPSALTLPAPAGAWSP